MYFFCHSFWPRIITDRLGLVGGGLAGAVFLGFGDCFAGCLGDSFVRRLCFGRLERAGRSGASRIAFRDEIAIQIAFGVRDAIGILISFLMGMIIA